MISLFGYISISFECVKVHERRNKDDYHWSSENDSNIRI